MEKQKKKIKISLKLVILIALTLIILLITLTLIITKVKLYGKNVNIGIENFVGDFDGDGKIETLSIKTKSWEVYVPNNIADDTGDRSETTLFLDNKKIEHEYISGYIEIIDVDNDGIDEIKTTYNIIPPGHPGTYCQIYKLNNNKFKKIDSYRVFYFTYYKKEIEALSFDEITGLELSNAYNHISDKIFLEKQIEIQLRNTNCKILSDNKTIYEYETISDISTTIINEDLDNDKNMELLVDNIIIKYENDELKIYNDEDFFVNNNVILNIFEVNCDFDNDGIIDNIKIKQAIRNEDYNKKEILYTDFYINNIKPKTINAYSLSGPYEILSINNDLINKNIIIINIKNKYSGEISKEGIMLDNGTLRGIKEKSLNTWYNN